MQEMLISAQLSLKMGSIVNYRDYEIIEFYETSNSTYTKLNYQDAIFIFIAESHRIYWGNPIKQFLWFSVMIMKIVFWQFNFA